MVGERDNWKNIFHFGHWQHSSIDGYSPEGPSSHQGAGGTTFPLVGVPL